MPLYYRDYDLTGYPPIDSEELGLVCQQYATLTLPERIRFTKLHGGRPLGQTIPPKKVPKIDPLLYVGKGRTDYLPTPRCFTSYKFQQPRRAPFLYRRATKYVIWDTLLPHASAAPTPECSSDDEDRSAFTIYQRDLREGRSYSHSPTEVSSHAVTSPRSPSALEMTQEFLHSVTGESLSSRQLDRFPMSGIFFSESGAPRCTSGSPFCGESPHLNQEEPQPKVLLPKGCDPLHPSRCSLPLIFTHQVIPGGTRLSK